MRRLAISMIMLAIVANACAHGEGPAAVPETTAAAGASGSGSGGGSISASTTTHAPTGTAPTPTTAAAPPTTLPPVDPGTRDDPLPAGTPVTIGNWEVTVLSSTLDATEAVLAENSFNDPPDAGDQYSMVRVAVTYRGEGSASPLLDLTFGAVGDSAVTYGFADDCGVTPDGYPSLRDVFPGGTVTGNLCWGIRAADAGTLVLMAEEAFSFDDERFLLEIPAEGNDFGAPPSAGIVNAGGPAGSRGNPIPTGQAALIGSWEITVIGSAPDATDLVTAENTFNDPPNAGNQFLLVQVQATNRGIGSETPFEVMTFSAVGPSSVAYSYEDDCGVVPDPFPDFTEVFAGGTVEGNLCWSVTGDDAAALVLIVDAAFSIEDERAFFEIPR